MLVSLTVKNWLSFRDETTLSLKSSRERNHQGTLIPLPKKYGNAKLLPLASIYGPNASGKTALFEAMQLLQHMVVHSPDPDDLINFSPFLLDDDSANKPTKLGVEILIDDEIYRYTLELTPERIVEESLVHVLSKTEAIVFNRSNSALGPTIATDLNRALMDSLPGNQTFLYAAVKLGCEALRPIYDWFAKTLKIIGLETSFAGYSQMMVRDDFREFADGVLKHYAGIDGIDLQSVEEGELKEHIKRIVLKHAKEEDPVFSGIHQVFSQGPQGTSYYFIRVENGNVIDVSRMVMRHRKADGSTIAFEISNESAGTRRLINLMPAFFDLEASNDNDPKVYLIDEIDRSFHTAMTLGLLGSFLDSCSSNSRKQLVFNLHDLAIMDSSQLRKDEMWVLNKDLESGSSNLVSIGHHPNTRSDTSILKAYKAEAYGGWPQSSRNLKYAILDLG